MFYGHHFSDGENVPLEQNQGLSGSEPEQYAWYSSDKENVPLEQRRGLGGIDLNHRCLAVLAPVGEVAPVCKEIFQALYWKSDAYGQEIEIRTESLLVFQFRSHPWTIINAPILLDPSPQIPLSGYNFRQEDAQLLSRLLNTASLFYLISDTGGYIGYHLYERGESIERLYFGESIERLYFTEDEDLEKERQDEDYLPERYEFVSQLRQLEEEDILLNAYDIVEDFLEERDIYLPTIEWNESLKSRQKITLSVQDLERDNFERIDYLTLTEI